ncbi:MAG: PhzF family phenazine biosynthesis protein [Gemmatimonadales bacterium]
MTTLGFHTLDVFTDRRFGGNPLAVIFGGEDAPDATMQLVAREFNLSETVFVLPPTDPGATHRVRIFTPARELPFAGHPTIGTAILLTLLGDARLADGGARVVLEEPVGLVPVSIRLEGGRPVFGQLTAARLPVAVAARPPAADLAAVLSLAPADIIEDERDRPEAVSCGVPYLMIPVRNRAALARAAMAEERWRHTLRSYWAADVYVFCRDPELPGSAIRARMFALELGIVEDPATGSAVAGLAGYLAPREARGSGTLRWTVEQGFEMGRPSLLHLEADVGEGAVRAVRVGGAAVPVSQGTLPADGP